MYTQSTLHVICTYILVTFYLITTCDYFIKNSLDIKRNLIFQRYDHIFHKSEKLLKDSNA